MYFSRKDSDYQKVIFIKRRYYAIDRNFHSKLIPLSVIWSLEGENTNCSNLQMSAYEKIK